MFIVKVGFFFPEEANWLWNWNMRFWCMTVYTFSNGLLSRLCHNPLHHSHVRCTYSNITKKTEKNSLRKKLCPRTSFKYTFELFNTLKVYAAATLDWECFICSHQMEAPYL